MKLYHLPASALLAEDRKICLYGIWNRSIDRAYKLAKRYKIRKVYKSFDLLLTDKNIDALVIAVNPEVSGELPERALVAGLPVLIEKPPASSAQKAEKIGRFTTPVVLWHSTESSLLFLGKCRSFYYKQRFGKENATYIEKKETIRIL